MMVRRGKTFKKIIFKPIKMKTKEQFLEDQLNCKKLTPIQWDGIMRAMEEYAQQQVEIALTAAEIDRLERKEEQK